MGIIYLAHDPDLQRPVAIKVVRPGVSTGRARLLREGQAVAKLRHPNVIAVFDVGAHGDDLFIAMEYVPGANLLQWLRAVPRSPGEVLDRFIAAGWGLAAAHRVGLVHRDFKPDNILLGDDGRVVVSDFGLVQADEFSGGERTIVSDIEVTRTVGVIGTPAYMSPEQFRDAPLDGRSDQFSFCVALWQGLFGVRPFDAGPSSTTDVEVLTQAVLAGTIQLPSNHDVPSRVVRALRRGLSVDPRDRFPTMDMLLTALQVRDPRRLAGAAAVGTAVALGALAAAIFRSPAAVPPQSSPPACDADLGRVSAIWNPNVRQGYLGAAGDAADANEDAAWFDELARRWQAAARGSCRSPRAASERARTETCLSDSLVALERALTRTDRRFWPELLDPRACVHVTPLAFHELRTSLGSLEPYGAISPDQQQIAFVANSGGPSIRALIGADGESLRADVLGGLDRVYGWWQDGRSLLARSGNRVVRIDLQSGARTELPWSGDVLAVADDGTLAARRDDDAITLLAASGAEKTHVATPGRVTAIAIEPDSHRVAIAVAGERDGWCLVIADAATGRFVRRALRVHGDGGSVITLAWAAPGRLVVSGSGRRDASEALWLLDIDHHGAIDGPPAMLTAPRRNTNIDVLAVAGSQALVAMVDVSNRVLRHHAGMSSPVPGLLDGRLRGVSASTHRILVVDQDLDRAHVFGVDGERIGDGDGATGLPVLYDGTLWFARADDGDVVLTESGGDTGAGSREIRIDGDVPTHLDRIRCSTGDDRRCFVSWWDREGIRHALLGGRKLRRAFYVPVNERDLDLNPDGRRALAMTRNALYEYDTSSRRLRLLHREDVCEVGRGTWSADGASIYYLLECEGRPTEIRTQAAAPDAEPRTVATIDPGAHITGLAAIGDDDVVYSTRAYDSRLVLIEGLPLP